MLLQDVNFFGHAAVATWSSDEAGVALGAMLPDFQSMSGARMASSPDAGVAAEVELHHRTDAVFHSADDLRAIRAALAEHQPRVAVAADTVLRGMRAALDPR